ncbi:GGDEF domain-containing protein [Acidovorax sp. sic0104]|uniref:GGDEF domain-containing protein n=1 Tax=Acidovorax sp. sic0104 TaxID=2854784 RepID=UPI001C454D24|nr:GGDEF domain-containing protein [Acidovorax sp. sic0104]MBV7543536.1 GGDEF domain-containing protein [Acidovorax sp. sic0104]
MDSFASSPAHPARAPRPYEPAQRGSSVAGKAYWAMAQRVALTAAAIDGLYIVLFLWLGSVPLAVVNVASIAMYLGAYALIRRRRNTAGILLIWLEVIAHSALGSLLVGWDSGFHYYLWLFIPAVVIANSGRYAVPVVLALLAYYLGLRFVCDQLGPLAPLAGKGQQIVNAIHVCVVFGMFAALAAFYRRTILIAENRLLRQATLDGLTGLNNRAHFQTLAGHTLTRIQRTGEPVALMLCDIDHFKQVNDRHGHATGDRVLVAVAQVLRHQLRESDVVARWGGEEFLALMPASSRASAAEAAERIRVAIEQIALENQGTPVPLSMSFGVAQVTGSDDLPAAIARADQALYQSKHTGRNRVSVG